MAQSSGLPEFKTMISAWLDEVKPLVDSLQELFPQTAEGELKYVLTIHLMMKQVCEVTDIPLEHFHNLVPTLIATWFKHGKPESFYDGRIHINSKNPN